MKAWAHSAIVLFCVGCSSPIHGAAGIEFTDVFGAGEAGNYAYRIPVMEQAPDGTLLAFAEARRDNAADPGMGDNDIDLVTK